MKHLLGIQQLQRAEIEALFKVAAKLKRNRGVFVETALKGQTWALLFSKPSTRTRVSFEVGIRELGGGVMFLNANDVQLGRGESIADTARVFGRMVHGTVIRTFAHRDVEDFAKFSDTPTINALTDDEHPCQILTDIFTFEEKRASIAGKVVAFFGDGACNVANSWLFAAAKLDFEFRIAAPVKYQPSAELRALAGGNVVCTTDARAAAEGADLLYTDVSVSMGREEETAERLRELAPYQINQTIVDCAQPDALVMHCLPAHRGEEIDEKTFEANAATIFDQAENRLHVQKAILVDCGTSWRWARASINSDDVAAPLE